MRAVVIGGGIAGISVAYELAAAATVTLLEMEPLLAYHTTGRSAAIYTEHYGSPAIRPLTRASRPFLDHPPPGLVEGALLRPREVMMVAWDHQRVSLERLLAEAPAAKHLSAAAARQRCPALRAERLIGAMLDPVAAEIDVGALHQAYVRGVRRRGGRIVASAPATSFEQTSTGWKVAGPDEVHEADVVVNAAGAWADDVAVLAGARPIGLVPKRRTAFMVNAPAGAETWPMLVDADEEWYVKPEGPQLLCSPADATPSPPCDARPREIDVALAIERINGATTLGIRSVTSQWAGLRTFAPDLAMVVGEDPQLPGFWWLAGQGGTGIQTAPGAARLLAGLIMAGEAPADLLAAGVDPAAVAPGRFRAASPGGVDGDATPAW